MDLLFTLAVIISFTAVAVGSIALLGLAVASLVINRSIDNADFISDIEE